MNLRIRLAFHLEPPLGLHYESDTAPHRIDPLDVTITLEKQEGPNISHSILLVERSVEAPAGTEHVLTDIFAGRIPNVGATHQWVRVLVASGLTAEEAILAKPGDPFATTVLFDPDTLPNQLRDLVLKTTTDLTESARMVLRSWRTVFEDMKNAYDVRSSVVHGSKPKENKLTVREAGVPPYVRHSY